jgi:hypothetical protein
MAERNIGKLKGHQGTNGKRPTSGISLPNLCCLFSFPKSSFPPLRLCVKLNREGYAFRLTTLAADVEIESGCKHEKWSCMSDSDSARNEVERPF